MCLYIGGVAVGPKALWTMGIVFLLNLIVVVAFYKEFKFCSFDPGMAATLGISVGLLPLPDDGDGFVDDCRRL